MIAPARSQLRRKSFYVLSPLSEGHAVFQPRLGEHYGVPLPRPSGRCVTLICSTSVRPPRPPALAPSSPQRQYRPALWQDQPTSAKPPPKPSPVEEPQEPACTLLHISRAPSLKWDRRLSWCCQALQYFTI